MFSPFKDRKGQFLNIHDIKYNHIKQLEDIDEGYKVEFKETFDNNVKKKIPAIVTSFANSEGGWLIIGINDDTHKPTFIQKERGDYSQKISLILKNNKVSPLPRFETKFIYKPNSNRKEGILIVYIYEGNSTPYVSNGTIYVRNGSNKEPVLSERSTIEFLYRKSENFKNDLEKFCERTIKLPYSKEVNGNEKISYPICNIFIKNITVKTNIYKKFEEKQEEIIEVIKELYNSSAWRSVQKILGGLVFRGNKLDPSSTIVCNSFELMNDFSCKFCFPLLFKSEEDKVNARQHLTEVLKLKWEQEVPILDGEIGIKSIMVGMKTFVSLLEKFELDSKDFALCFEIENAGNAIIYFNSLLYDEYIKEFGVSIHSEEKTKSNVIFFSDNENYDMKRLPSEIAISFFSVAFGMFPEKVYDIMDEIFENE